MVKWFVCFNVLKLRENVMNKIHLIPAVDKNLRKKLSNIYRIWYIIKIIRINPRSDAKTSEIVYSLSYKIF